MMNVPPAFYHPQPPLDRRQSKLGVASFVMGVSIPLVLILLIVLTMVLGTDTKDAVGWYAVWALLIFGLLAPLGHLTGVILGVVAVIPSRNRKVFPVLGITLNAILGSTGVIILVVILKGLFGALGAFR